MKRILFAVLAGLVALVVFDFPGDNTSSDHTSLISATSGRRSESAAPTHGGTGTQWNGQFGFRKRAPIGEPQGLLFGSHSWQPLPLTTSKVAAPPPVAPPMPYKFAGASVYNGQLQIFLAKGDSIIPVSLGETIEGGYRVEAIDERQITLMYLPLEQNQVIPISTSLSFAGVRVSTAGNSTASSAIATSGHAVGDGQSAGAR